MNRPRRKCTLKLNDSETVTISGRENLCALKKSLSLKMNEILAELETVCKEVGENNEEFPGNKAAAFSRFLKVHNQFEEKYKKYNRRVGKQRRPMLQKIIEKAEFVYMRYEEYAHLLQGQYEYKNDMRRCMPEKVSQLKDTLEAVKTAENLKQLENLTFPTLQWVHDRKAALKMEWYSKEWQKMQLIPRYKYLYDQLLELIHPKRQQYDVQGHDDF